MQGALTKISGVIDVNVSLPNNAILQLQENQVTIDELLAVVKATGVSEEIQN